MVKRFSLSIARDYVSNWGVREAVRELLQNAIDSSSEFEFEVGGNFIAVISRNSALSHESLVLGSSSKAGISSKIGSFGEGYKLALLVLKRLGKEVTVYNDGIKWTPEFRHNKDFKCDTLHIVESTYNTKSYPGGGLTFLVKGITEEELASIRESCLLLQSGESIGERVQTKYGDILLERSGSLYVNGLFVCKIKNMRYSYDIKPEYLRLERDRQTVSSFDIQWLLKDVWNDSGCYERLWEMVDSGAMDAEYICHALDENAANNYYEQHYLKKPETRRGAVAVSSPSEVQDKTHLYGAVQLVTASALGVLNKSPAYALALPAPAPEKTVKDELEAWIRKMEKAWSSKFGMIPDPVPGILHELRDMVEGWKIKEPENGPF